MDDMCVDKSVKPSPDGLGAIVAKMCMNEPPRTHDISHGMHSVAVEITCYGVQRQVVT